MTSKRVPLALILGAVLFVTPGFAATKKIHRNDGSRDWNDLVLQNDSPVQNDPPLQNGDLPSIGSSVSSGSSSVQYSSAFGRSGSPLILRSPSTPDSWNGGIGNWSNGGNWSTGSSPGSSNDVTINSGGDDTVTLDVSGTINSLALGGGYGEGSSELKDNGVTQELSINQGLTVGGGGYLDLTGGSTVSAGADSSNAGRIFLFNGSTLAITGNLTITLPSGGFGIVDLENASVLTVRGDVNNAGTLATNQFGNGGGNTLNITGTLTNGNAFELAGPGDRATLGGFINSPFSNTVVIGGSTLQINGNANNSYGLYLGVDGPGNDTLTITGTLTNTKCCLSSGGVDIQSDSKATVGGAVTNSGDFYVGTGSTATFGSGLTNSGTVDVDG